MGYYEHVCQLCAVSFAIARIRTANEPPEAAWKYYGHDYISHHPEQCHPSNGCAAQAPRDGSQQHEHIAGPKCTLETAYSGARIRLDEMKGCRAIRAVVRKGELYGKDWNDEDDDAPWERETRYFLSGTGDGSPDDSPLEDMDKVRHGLDAVVVTNLIDAEDGEQGLPVHPHCWAMFETVSLRESGFIDVHGFWRFSCINDGYEDFWVKFPRHPAVLMGSDQWWRHQGGSEWLAASPVSIPGFAVALARHVANMGEDFNVEANVFSRREQEDAPCPEQTTHELDASNDPMSRLPPELYDMIRSYLDSRSIANARLVFRSTGPMSNVTFRRLLFQDVPWLWEAEDLPARTTDWYRLYMEAKFGWAGIKGFQNRKRVWKDISEMLRRIRRCRESGEICGVTGWEHDADDGDVDDTVFVENEGDNGAYHGGENKETSELQSAQRENK